MMKLHDREIYLTPDGRRVLAQEDFGIAGPSWTLWPFPDVGAALELDDPAQLRETLSQYLYVEEGRIIWLDYKDSPRFPIPMVRDTGWTEDDLVIADSVQKVSS